jgi:hypothetical protein
MFDCAAFHSEFHALEVTRHTRLTDKFCMHYFELPKLPKSLPKDNGLQLWLALFNAETEEELEQIEALEVPEMKQAIGAYRHVTATDEFKYIEWMRQDAKNIQASALGHARREGWNEGRAEGYHEANNRWQRVVADKDKDIASKNVTLAENAAQIEALHKQLAQLQEQFIN